jgi:hypothetical protein
MMREVFGHDDGGVIGRFFTQVVEDRHESRRQGRPVFKDVPFVEIIVPGAFRAVVIRPVQDEDKRRWPAAWAMFERGESGWADGTPIEQWPLITPDQARELQRCSVLSVEACAAVADAHLSSLGLGARKLRERAQIWLAMSPQPDRGSDEMARMVARVAALEEQLRQFKDKGAVAPQRRKAQCL